MVRGGRGVKEDQGGFFQVGFGPFDRVLSEISRGAKGKLGHSDVQNELGFPPGARWQHVGLMRFHEVLDGLMEHLKASSEVWMSFEDV